ncbi:MAG: winged helix DNA-binding domain-containing protein [Bacteroidia bacterium]
MEIPRLRELRLRAQGILPQFDGHASDCVHGMCAMQAQDLGQARWALGVRVPGLRASDVDAALARGEIVRTWVMRGTLHLLHAEDVRWVVSLVEGANRAKTRPLHRRLELDEETLARSVDVICRALEGNGGESGTIALQRKEVFAAVEAAGISTEGLRGAFMLYEAAHLGLICLGPMAGKQDTYVLADKWLPEAKPKSRAEAIAELAGRYFQSHGPATLEDFVWWSGLGVREARQGLMDVAGMLERVAFDGMDYWMGREVSSAPSNNETLLLPGFDEYLIAYRNRSLILDEAHSSAVISSNGIFRPFIVQDGRVVGTWKLEKGKVKLDAWDAFDEQEMAGQMRRVVAFYQG